jgi:hypothetical protein
MKAIVEIAFGIRHLQALRLTAATITGSETVANTAIFSVVYAPGQ